MTQDKEADNRAVQDVDKFRKLFDAAPDAWVVINDKGTIEFVNLQAERSFGYRRDELIHKRLEILVPERFRSSHVGHRSRFAAAPRTRPMGSGLELFGRKKDGTEFPIEVSLSPVETDDGTLVSAAIRDITDRRQAMLAMQRLAAVVDHSDDAIISKTPDGMITSWNRGAQRIFGYSAERAIGKHITLLIPPGREHEEAQILERFRAGERIEQLDTVRRRSDGTDIHVSLTISPIRDSSGELVSISTIARDVTDRKRIEAEARRSSDHLRSAIESIPGAFALFDAQDRLSLCNSTFRQMFDHGLEETIVGHTFARLVDATLAADVFAHGGESKQAFRARWFAYHKNPIGNFDLRTKDGRSLRLNDRRTVEGGTVTTIWDLTEDVQHEQELHRMRKLAETANAAKSEFLASMSHELRTPLTAILGFAELLHLDKKTPLSERQQEQLKHIIKGGEHLLCLINDVLDLSRIEAGQVAISPEPVYVADVLTEVHTTLGPMASRAEIALIVEPVPADLPNVIADRTRFSQIVMNFGSNAIKYGRKGGTARFAASARTNGFVRISVIDNGIGIVADKHDKIFQPFQRAGQETGPVEGTGIGLAITKRLAQIMGGKVGFRSTAGKGSEFWIDLPVHETTAAALVAGPQLPPVETPLPAPPNHTRLMVYIEDNPSSIAFMKVLVERFLWVQLLTAPTAEIGIELVRAHRPDVVVMDINLPGMNGFAAMRRLREWPETRDIPVIALSAAVMNREAQTAAGAGFYRYLTKPVKVKELTAVLHELLKPDESK